jgi:hypothetical protein
MTSAVTKQRKSVIPNTPSPEIAEAMKPMAGIEWGPCMAALPSDRHRAFVWSLYQIPRGYGAHVKAAKMAGFGTSTTSAQSWSVIATRDERVLRSLAEEDERRIRASAPRAVRALEHLIEDPTHKDHCGAVSMILDRTNPIQQQHLVQHEHQHQHTHRLSADEVTRRILQLCGAVGVDVPALPAPIDAVAVEVVP